MKKTLILFFCLLFPYYCFAQQLEQFQKIEPRAEPFRFEIIKTDAERGAQTSTDFIWIYEKNHLIQELTGFKVKQSIYDGISKIRFEDVNFDGFLDLLLWSEIGNISRNQTYKFREPPVQHIWMYNPIDKQFEYQEELASFPYFQLDASKKMLFVEEHIRYAHCEHSTDRYEYQWKNNKLVFLGKKHSEHRNGRPSPILKN